jgi:hypothetical protein
MGGKDIVKAVRENSELTYDKLLEEINKSLNITVVEEDIKEEITEEKEEISILECEGCLNAENCSEISVKLGEEEMEDITVVSEESEKPVVGRPPAPEGEELFTCKQVADILGCTLVNIYLKISKGKIAVVGSPRKHRIPASELERLKTQSRTFKKLQAEKAAKEEF